MIRVFIQSGDGTFEIRTDAPYSPDVLHDVMNRLLEMADSGVQWMRTDGDVTDQAGDD